MIKIESNSSKNLLAFSAGIDSTALFFILLNNNIPFDIAIVDYNIREQSKQEVLYAQELAKKYNKKCHLKEVTLESTSNFEKNAREIRYSFFEELIKENSYQTLFTAHQLNDKLEWFLMQLSKGAGLPEILGLNKEEKRALYTLKRPLLDISKDELKEFLIQNNISYFIDQSNYDKKYRRNLFREEFSNNFLLKYKEGVKNSFEYLQNDLDSLNIEQTPIYYKEELVIYKALKDDNINIRIIDKAVKKLGFLISSQTRKEILEKREVVISHKLSVSITANHIWISPYLTSTMNKDFKELCRVNKIPKNSRAYLSTLENYSEIIKSL